MNISGSTYPGPGYPVQTFSPGAKSVTRVFGAMDSQNSRIAGNEPSSQTSPTSEVPEKNNSVSGTQKLSREELRVLENLKQIDAKVKRHEMAHIAAGGRYIRSGATFSYKRGPDGKNYAVGGEVSIDTSPVPGDPRATIQKMRQVRTAALAPADPSAQDLKVASAATSAATKAMSELMVETARSKARSNEITAFGNIKDAADSYQKVSGLPETDTSTFRIAV